MIRQRFLLLILLCHFSLVPCWAFGQFPGPGDYDADGFVNLQDASIWEATYGSTTDLIADGNQNGVIDQGDYNLVYENFGSSAFLSAAGGENAFHSTESVVSLIYDPSSGNLSLDAHDSSERVYAFKLTTAGLFNEDVAIAPFQQFVVDPNGVLPEGDTLFQSASEIGQVDLNGIGLPDERFNLGPILPTGLSMSELQAQLGGSQMFGGGGGLQLDVAIVAAPEPSSIVLCGLAGSVFLAPRRWWTTLR